MVWIAYSGTSNNVQEWVNSIPDKMDAEQLKQTSKVHAHVQNGVNMS